MLLALEVIMQNVFAAVAGENEINTRALELTAKQQLSVGNNDRIGRSVRGVNRFRKKMTARMLAQRVRNRGVKFAEVIHPVTAMVNKYIISKV